jgi:hypothetical protein
MGLYTLKVPSNKDLSAGILEKAETDTVKYEKL